ncbi:MAG: FtsX-like permease family protein [Gemmataceae bacterium]|nr:FtsX-like permease family protein [Gemmataceae bacterium]
MVAIALKMLGHNKSRLFVTMAGIGVAFFLSAAQVGLLVGWCNTTSALIRHADADVWVMAQQTPAFDYGTAIPRTRIYQVRSVEGVAWAEGLFMAWNIWQRPDGRRVNVELVGLDDSLVGGPWAMQTGDLGVVYRPDTVIIDALYLEALGVPGVGAEVELIGSRAVVGGVSREVRTFTASPFVFTSLESAIRYDKRYRDDEITYVLVRCANGYAADQVRDAIAREVPSVEVLTSAQFAVRTVKYWMLETGIGITVVVTAILGLVVGTVIISQTLFAITQDHLPHYATLLALGFGRRQLAAVILAQSALLGLGGIVPGGGLFFYTAWLSATTPIPLETTGPIFTGLVLLALLCCLLASFVSLRSVVRIDPVCVFRV